MGKYKYGIRSERVLSEVHFELDLLCREMLAMSIMDLAAICGRRGKKAQGEAYMKGYSQVQWPDSKHNVEEYELSDAVDLAPIVNGVIPWNPKGKNFPMWYIMGGMAMACAKKLSIDIKWGYNFKKFKDLPHIERRSKWK